MNSWDSYYYFKTVDKRLYLEIGVHVLKANLKLSQDDKPFEHPSPKKEGHSENWVVNGEETQIPSSSH